MAKQLESKISSQCLKYLNQLKAGGTPIYWEHRSGTGGFAYKKGIPDMFIVIGPVHIECEMKTLSGHLAPMQEKWKRIFTEQGTPYVNPHTFEEFKQYIDQFL